MAARGQHRLLAPGTRAPDFRLELLSGGSATLAEVTAGGPALLAFFKVTCPTCQLTFPFLQRIHDAINEAGGIRIFGISQNDAGDTREFNREFGVTFPTLLDSEDGGFPASNDYGISSVPTMFLVSPEGMISHVIEGWGKKEMESLSGGAAAGLFRHGEYVPEWKAG